MKLTLALALAFTSSLAVPSASAEQELSVRRFALIVAANDGGPDRVRLRYAESDARLLARVLEGIGGVAPEDQTFLVQPTRPDLESAFAVMNRRLADARGSAGRLELVVYYSGHSDAEGILLGGERYPYRAFKDALDTLPADVRIAILDSCASGAMTRLKGGVRRPPFMVDSSNRVRGYAVLTSSSEDESAQESDRLGASFFTHYLVSGLRGAGDLSQDGRVTLNEAYNFAFHETLARTEKTRGGAQHAAYDIQLVGTGDVVMTDLRSTSAGLELDENLAGRVYIRDGDGRLAVELRKIAGRPIELGLEPGVYTIVLDQGEERFKGQVAVGPDQRVKLDVTSLEKTEVEATTRRGDGPPPNRRIVPFNLSILPAFSLNGDEDPVLNNLTLSLGLSRAYDLEGVAFALGGNWLDHDMTGVQAGIGFNSVANRAHGVQWTVGFNLASQLTGVQSAVGFNQVDKDATGIQMAAGFNTASERILGAQFAAGFNYARRLDGLQVASGLNVAGDMRGVQASMVNIADGDALGVQVGLVNYGESVAGLQLGLINVVKRTEGVSLGLINYATEDGIFDLVFLSSDVALGGAGIQLGTRYVYTAAFAGLGTWEDPQAASFGLTLGARLLATDHWMVNFEAGTGAVFDRRAFTDPDLLTSTRLTVGYRLVDGLAIFAGPTFNVLVEPDDISPEGNPLAPGYASRPNDGRVYMWPGLVAGIQVF